MVQETDLSKKVLMESIKKLEPKMFYVDGWVYLPNFAKHQTGRGNEKIRKGIELLLAEIPKNITDKIGHIYPMDTLSMNHGRDSNNRDRDTDRDRDRDNTNAPERDFDTFLEKYPNKENKDKAKRIWLTRGLHVHFTDIMNFVDMAGRTDRWKKGFIKNVAAFLTEEAWLDDLDTYKDKVITNDFNKAPEVLKLY